MYVNDFHFYPQSRYTRHWTEPLNAYLKQAPDPLTNYRLYGGVFLCPSGLERRIRAGRWSYGYNETGVANIKEELALGLGFGDFGSIIEGRAPTPTPESNVRAPSDMIAIADGFMGYYEGRIGTGGFPSVIKDKVGIAEGDPFILRNSIGIPPIPNDIQIAQKRHGGKLNVTFCDGHVEAMKVQTLFFEETDEAYKRWNRDNEPHRPP